jgi:hypothetical protein
MHGLHTQTKDQIHRVIHDLFDKAALSLVGPIPKLHHKKITLLGFAEGLTLASLFVAAMNNKWLNHVEQDVLKGILDNTYNYIDVLKNKTSTNVTNRVEALAREARLVGNKIPESEINKIVTEELGKAKTALETIALAEGTKTRNLGAVMEISRAAGFSGVKDPVVGFSGPFDGKTCEQCERLFLTSDGKPRLWKLSECQAGYFKRGDKFPSLLGLHPRCRHTPFYVPLDWGFDSKGHLGFVGIGHSELDKQREEI